MQLASSPSVAMDKRLIAQPLRSHGEAGLGSQEPGPTRLARPFADFAAGNCRAAIILWLIWIELE